MCWDCYYFFDRVCVSYGGKVLRMEMGRLGGIEIRMVVKS
jgi:hypothetical protein